MSQVSMKGKSVTIALTDEQKKAIAKSLGVKWDEVTFGAPQGLKKGRQAEAVPPDVNLVVAMGNTYTVS